MRATQLQHALFILSRLFLWTLCNFADSFERSRRHFSTLAHR
jgi:hypothetical protein